MNQLTIGIASYNQQEYLPDAIESALNQTVQCDVIVCNDGSTDNSLAIAKKYPVKVIDQINKGLASARNAIIMNATTEYILFLDADDILQDNCAERILDVARSGGDIISPSFKTFGTSSELVILIDNPKLEDFKAGNRVAYCSAFKRSILQEVGGYSPKMVFGYEDMALTINLLRIGKQITTIPEPLWLYRTKEKSMITTAQEHHEELMEQIRKDNPNCI